MRFWRFIIIMLWLFQAGGAVSAKSEWNVPYWGVISFGEGWIIQEGQPMTNGDALPNLLRKERFLGGKYVVLTKQNEADFIYAYAGLVPLDNCFIVQKRIPIEPVRAERGKRMISGNLPVVSTPMKHMPSKNNIQTVLQIGYREVPMVIRPETSAERLQKVTEYWNEKLIALGTDVNGFTRKKISGNDIYVASWIQNRWEKGVLFSNSYRAWIFDTGVTSYMLFVAIDGRQETLGKQLEARIEKSKA